jgi:hypothetical protein
MKHMNRSSLILHIFTLCLLVLCVSCKFLHDDDCKSQPLTVPQSLQNAPYAAFETSKKKLESDILKVILRSSGSYPHDYQLEIQNSVWSDQFPRIYLHEYHSCNYVSCDPIYANYGRCCGALNKYQRWWNFRNNDLNPYKEQWQKDTCQLQLFKRETDSTWDYFFGRNTQCNDNGIERNSRRSLSTYLWHNTMVKDFSAVLSNEDSIPGSVSVYSYDLSFSWKQKQYDQEVFMYYVFMNYPKTVQEDSFSLMVDLYGELDSYQRSPNEKHYFSKWFFMPDRVVRNANDGNQYATISLVYMKNTSRLLSGGQWQITDIIENELKLEEPVRMLHALDCTQEDDGCLELYNRFRRQDVTSPGCYCLNIVWNEFSICDHLDKIYDTSTGETGAANCGSPIIFLRDPDADHAVKYFNRLEGITTGIKIEIPSSCMFHADLETPVNSYSQMVSDEIFEIPYETHSEHNILNPWVRTLQSNRVATCLKISLLNNERSYRIQCSKATNEYFLQHNSFTISEDDYSFANFRFFDNTGKVLPARMNGRFQHTPDSAEATAGDLVADDWTDDSYTCKTGYFEEFNTVQFSRYCAQNPECNQTSMERYDFCNENNWGLKYGVYQYNAKQSNCESITHYQYVDNNGRRDCLHRSVEAEQGVYFTGQIDRNSNLVYSACTTCVSGEQGYTVRACSNVLDARCKCPDKQIFGRLSLPEGTALTNAQKYMTGHNTSECISCRTCNPLEGFYAEQPCGHQVLYWSGDVSEETQIPNDYNAGAGYYTVVQDTQCGTCNQSCEPGQYSSCSKDSHCQDCSCDFGELGTQEAYCYVNTTVCDGTGFQNAGAEVKRFDEIVCEAGFYKNLDSVLNTVGSGKYYKYANTIDRTRENICRECTLTSKIKTDTGPFDNSYKLYCEGTTDKETYRMLNDYFYNKSLACDGTSYQLEEQAGCQQCPEISEFSSHIEILKCDQANCAGQNDRLRNDVNPCDHECNDEYYQDEEGACQSCDEPCPDGQYRPKKECTNNIQRLPHCESCTQVKCGQGNYIVKCTNGEKTDSCKECETPTCNSDQVLQQCPGNAYEDTSRCVDCGAENTDTLQIPANATARTSANGDACGFQCNAGFYREENECHMCPTDVLKESCCLDWFAENEGEKKEFCPYALLLDTCDIPGVQHGRPGCVCKAGNVLSGNKCTACSANRFTETDFNHTTCKSCKKGKYSNAGSSSCTPCPVNKYRENIGMSQCQVCEAGTSNQTGQYNCETGCYRGEKARAKVELGYWVYNKDTYVCKNVFEIPSSCLINGTLYCETLEQMRWGYTQETCERNSAFEYSSQEPTYTTECVPCESGYAWSGNFNPFDDSATEDTSSNGGGTSQDSDASSGSSDTCTSFLCNA